MFDNLHTRDTTSMGGSTLVYQIQNYKSPYLTLLYIISYIYEYFNNIHKYICMYTLY